MYTHETKIRVRYAETDQMGYVYYGNYSTYYEVARVECIRSLGLSYKALEKKGIMLPVLEFKIKYIKPAFYDDVLRLKTEIKELPGTRIRFHVTTYNAENDILNIGEVTLVFVNVETKKPTHPDPELISALEPFFA